MRISKMTLTRIGPFQEAVLDFPPKPHPDMAEIHILTGPNGSGKSTALYALAALFGDPVSAAARMWNDSVINIELDHNQTEWGITFNYDLLSKNMPRLFSIPSDKITHHLRHPGIHKQYLESIISKPDGQTPPIDFMLSQMTFGYAGNRKGDYAAITGIKALDQPEINQNIFFHSGGNTDQLSNGSPITRQALQSRKIAIQP